MRGASRRVRPERGDDATLARLTDARARRLDRDVIRDGHRRVEVFLISRHAIQFQEK